MSAREELNQRLYQDAINKARKQQLDTARSQTARVKQAVKDLIIQKSYGNVAELKEDEEYCKQYDKLYAAEEREKRAVEFGKALYDFKPTENGQLTFSKGDIIIILSKEHTSWWQGQSGNTVGLFPNNYVEIVSDEEVRKYIDNQAKAAPTIATTTTDDKPKWSEMSETELQSEALKFKTQADSLLPEIDQLKAEVEQLRDQRHQLWKTCKSEMEDIEGLYFGIDPLEELIYDVRFVMGLMDAQIEGQKKIVKSMDGALTNLDKFNQELTTESAHNSQLKHTKKDVDPPLLDYQQKLVHAKANSDEGLQNKTHAAPGGLYDLLSKLATELEKKMS